MIAAGFSGSKIMDLIERNYRTWCAQSGVELIDSPADAETLQQLEKLANNIPEHDDVDQLRDDGPDIEDIMDETEDFAPKVANGTHNGTKLSKPRSQVAATVRIKVQKVLSETGLALKRAGKCDQVDFLNLLWAFNQEGIHFN
jgi:18S rRNA (adenine1779-N6/adenine1780-N6)-dimethyltransferase